MGVKVIAEVKGHDPCLWTSTRRFIWSWFCIHHTEGSWVMAVWKFGVKVMTKVTNNPSFNIVHLYRAGGVYSSLDPWPWFMTFILTFWLLLRSPITAEAEYLPGDEEEPVFTETPAH